MGEKKTAKTKELDFGGVPGAAMMLVVLPVTTLFITLACSKDDCSLRFPDIPNRWSDYFQLDAILLVFGWVGFQAFLYMLPVGKVVEGLTVRTGKKLKYRCNALFCMVISLATFAGLVYMEFPVTYVYKKHLQLCVAAMLLSFCLSVFLYIKSFQAPDDELALGGNSGNIIYDFFMGRELNPRIGHFDLKFFCELRPGLIGWVMLDLCFLVESYKELGHLSPALLLVTVFHAFYVADGLWYEEAILTTMDIVHDGFGFMLAFGDLAWVPFLYSLHARYLLEHNQEWSLPVLALITALEIVGYIIFRGANSQKNDFRKNPYDPKLAHLETIPTASGKRLLVSGWWGLCRHPNYLGDLFMATAWSLPCGFQNILPHFYPIYFLVLLIHRNARDDGACRSKYGADWDKYCKKVPYKIFPYIY